MTEVEKRVLAYVSLKSEFKNEVKEEDLSVAGREVFHWIKNSMNGTPLSDDIFEEKILNETDLKFKLLLDARKEIRNEPTFDRPEEENYFHSLLKQLKDYSYKSYVIRQLRTSLSYAEDYQIDKALDISRNIKYADNTQHQTAISSMIEAMEKLKVVKTGIKQMDNKQGIIKGDLITVEGESGHEKTMVTLWMMIQFLIHNPDTKAGYFEKEMPKHFIWVRVISRLMKMNQTEVQNKIMKEDINFQIAVKEKMDKPENKYAEALNRLIVYGPNDFFDAQDIIKKIETKELDFWCLDYFTLLSNRSSENQNEFYQKQANDLKRSLDRNNNLGMIISQLKHGADLEMRKIKIPTEADMEYGKILKQLSAIVFAAFKPSNYYNDVDPSYFFLYERKSRHRKKSYIALNSIPEYCYYSQPEDHALPLYDSFIKNHVKNK